MAIVLMAGLLGLLGAAVHAQPGGEGQGPPATKVMVAQAQMMPAPATATFVATVEPVRRSRIASEVSGLVAEVPVREGDHVEAGDVLCRLDDERQRLRIAAEEAKLGALEARHEELLAGSRQEELKRLKALYENAVAEYERWSFEMQRIEKLYEGRSSNAKEYQDTVASFQRAKQTMIAAEAAYELAQNGPRQEVIAQAAYDVAAQKAEVDLLEADLAKETVRAPFTGYVTELNTEVGEWLQQGDQVVSMVDLSTVLVRVGAPESSYPFLQEGKVARVRVDALNRSFEGRIRHVVRQADERARTFPVEIELPNDEQVLAGGMFARATLQVGPDTETVAVPKDAVVISGGQANVGVVMPGQMGLQGMLMPVTLGVDIDVKWVAVTSGNISPGMPVVVRGNERLMPFPQPVQVVDQHGNPVELKLGGPGGGPGGPADGPGSAAQGG